MTWLDGEIYYHAPTSVVPIINALLSVNLSDSASREIVFNYPTNYLSFGITASEFCNTVVGVDLYSKQVCHLNLL